jgi:hypothetical protein
MQIKLVFEKSGDELIFDPINYEVAEYYIDNLNQSNNNNFATQYPIGQRISRNISSLQESIGAANKFIHLLTGTEIPSYTADDILNQQILNRLHAVWVNYNDIEYNIQEHRNSIDPDIKELAERLHHMLPDEIPIISLGTALDKLGLANTYNQINLMLHTLEETFNTISFRTDNWFSISNPFLKSILSNDVCNLRLSFNHLGRTLYNKYIHFDNKLECNDENSYDQLLGFVSIHLQRPQTIELSKEYTAWCRTRDINPTGDFLNIGNLPDIDTRLTEYRQLIYRNTRQNNRLTLIKG